MLRIGLTGGIGSGKSTVSELFAELGAPIIDTDRIAHELTAPGTAILKRIAELFGNHVLNSDGSLNRARLRELIFADPSRREQLERLLHPLIQDRALQLMRQSTGPYCILVVPLLLEKNWHVMVDRILVVDAPPELQLTRTLQRDGRPAMEVRAIIAAQISREQRLAAADDVLVNDADRAKLAAAVEALHRKYLQLTTPS